MVNIQSLVHPYLFSQKSKDVGKGFVYLPSLARDGLPSLRWCFISITEIVFLTARKTFH